ncbi:MAG: DUF2264 domain-containing protein, partial [Planctomycetota bacterium]
SSAETLRELSVQSIATRDDVARLGGALVDCALAKASPDPGGLDLGPNSASYALSCSRMEGFTRQLWAVAPMLAGDVAVPQLDLVRKTLTNGTNPEHPEFWGTPQPHDIRFVEIGGLGAAIALAPGPLFHDLSDAAQDRLATYLTRINHDPLWPNNWLLFRVLANAALRTVGRATDEAKVAADLEAIDSFYESDGWYTDGRFAGGNGGRADWYTPWALHFYPLLLAGLGQIDSDFAERAKQRAMLFAPQLLSWFARDGAGLPFGRSLVYRFAQSAFWGALAFANVEALPWGQIKGLLLRNLRWWLRQPIFSGDGLLTSGFGYPNLRVTEQYNAPGSPYWALKAFLPLALPSDHPFWTAEELPHPEPDAGRVVVQKPAAMLLWRDPDDGEVVALAGQHRENYFCHVAEKYSKFAYSTKLAFSVPGGSDNLAIGAHDSTLALSEDEQQWRVRRDGDAIVHDDSVLRIDWRPWQDVAVTTWLLMTPPGYVRVHRIESGRTLHAADGGFAVPRNEGDDERLDVLPGRAIVVAEDASAAIVDLLGERTGEAVIVAPNTNLLHPRTLLPTLRSRHEAGTFWLAAYVPMRTRFDAVDVSVQAERHGDCVVVSRGDREWCFEPGV